MTLRGNAVVAQSGGPTTVINSSACGVIEEARDHAEPIEGIYGANNGILGILREDLFDLGAERTETIWRLRQTPSSAIGSCRHKLGDLTKQKDQFQRLLNVFEAHNVRYFFYIGGNDSMDTANKVHGLAQEMGYELRVVGVPKTIDNDLVETDHCPGYGSVAKFLATCAAEAGRDTEAMSTFDPVTVMEAMGRNTGWIAAATGVARYFDGDAPDLIYVPEIVFDEDRFLDDVERTYRRLKRAFIVVSEGVKNLAGEYIAAQKEVDSFGHRQLGGVADYLRQLITDKLKLKARYNKLDTIQRNAMHFASRIDSFEAYECGQEAVRHGLQGRSGVMTRFVREQDEPYRCTIGVVELDKVANTTKYLPRHYMDQFGTHITEEMRRYVTPLMQGSVELRFNASGIPQFTRFERKPIVKKLPAFDV